MKGISDIGVLDAKVVNAQDEPDGSADVSPQTRSVGGSVVALCMEDLGELIVCDETSLFEAVHTSLDAHVDPVVVLKGVKVVVGADWLRDGVVG